MAVASQAHCTRVVRYFGAGKALTTAEIGFTQNMLQKQSFFNGCVK